MNNRKKQVLEVELEIMSIMISVSALMNFLSGDINKFLLVFFAFFIPLMHITSIAISDVVKFKSLFSTKLSRRILIACFLFILAAITHHFIYSLDWLISSYASHSSAVGLLTAVMLFVIILMDLDLDRPTLRRIIIGYVLSIVVIIPIVIICIWYYATYGILEVNRISFGTQPIFRYMMIFGSTNILLFFDTQSRADNNFKRSITIVSMILLILFGLFMLLGHTLDDPLGEAIFPSIYEKFTYIFTFVNGATVITIMATLSIVYYFIFAVYISTGIKYLVVLGFKYDKEKHETEEKAFNKHLQSKTRRFIIIFFICGIFIEIIGLKSNLGELVFTELLSLLSLVVMNCMLSIFALKIKYDSTNLISAILVFVTSIIGLISAILFYLM